MWHFLVVSFDFGKLLPHYIPTRGRGHFVSCLTCGSPQKQLNWNGFPLPTVMYHCFIKILYSFPETGKKQGQSNGMLTCGKSIVKRFLPPSKKQFLVETSPRPWRKLSNARKLKITCMHTVSIIAYNNLKKAGFKLFTLSY